MDGSADFQTLDELELLDDKALIAELRACEHLRRRLEARQATVARLVDRRKAFRADGHASIKGLLRVVTNRAPWEITTLIQTGELLSAEPAIATALAEGRLGVAQAHELAKARFHPRAGDKYADVADVLLNTAIALPFRDFKTVSDRWVNIADEDGANDRAETSHAHRDAFLHISKNGFFAELRGGTLQGEAMKEIVERFVQAEFDKDWAWTLEHHGDAACPDKMPRTDAQRRADAWLAIFHQAVSVPPGSKPPLPVVNVMSDPITFCRVLAVYFGIPVAPEVHAEAEALVPLDQRRCETSNGHAIAPIELLTAVLAGHVRRVLVDSASVVIDMGRLQRFFTGNTRVAAHMGQARCIYAGCETPAARCDTDHIIDWSRGGTTCPECGGPCCSKHNTFKVNHGYTITRDAQGRYHTWRPDGTEVA